VFGGPLFARATGRGPSCKLICTKLHEKHENLNENFNLPALSQLQFRPSLTHAIRIGMYDQSSSREGDR
jgi:hypothetical protein